MFLEAADGGLVRQQRVPLGQFGEQPVDQAADRRAQAARGIECRLECKRLDVLPVEQSLQPAVEQLGWDAETSPATAVAVLRPSAGLIVPNQAGCGIGDCLFLRTGAAQGSLSRSEIIEFAVRSLRISPR